MDLCWTEKGGTSLSARIKILTRKSVPGIRHRQVAGYDCAIYPLTQQKQFPAPTMRCSIYLPCHGAAVGIPQLCLNCFPTLLRTNGLLFTVSPPRNHLFLMTFDRQPQARGEGAEENKRAGIEETEEETGIPGEITRLMLNLLFSLISLLFFFFWVSKFKALRHSTHIMFSFENAGVFRRRCAPRVSFSV